MDNEGSKIKKSRRSRPLPPHVTARNLAIEKYRREILNNEFLDLARLVPALARVRRLSKTLILRESIQHFEKQRTVCISAANDVQKLLDENHQLTAELKSLRLLTGRFASPTPEPTAPSSSILELMKVQNETYGQFPAGFGDNWASSTTANTTEDNAGMSTQKDNHLLGHVFSSVDGPENFLMFPDNQVSTPNGKSDEPHQSNHTPLATWDSSLTTGGCSFEDSSCSSIEAFPSNLDISPLQYDLLPKSSSHLGSSMNSSTSDLPPWLFDDEGLEKSSIYHSPLPKWGGWIV